MAARYVLITPCRNEQEHLPTIIASIVGQTVRPVRWVIVDDGSDDDSRRILAEAAQQHDFIEVVARPDRGCREVGPGVIDAFYTGLDRIDRSEYDYVSKLDSDLEIDERYFERVIEEFERDPWLGTFSGKLFLRVGDRLVEERCGDENSVGNIKFYRAECFEEIGGFVRAVCWDGIDGHMCRMKGWVAASRHDPDLEIIHLRQMGSSHRSIWQGRMRWGSGKYFMGSALHYLIAICIYRCFERPFFIGGLGILLGYLRAMLRREPRFDQPDFRRFLRRFELRSLLFGKRRTARHYNAAVRARFPRRDHGHGAQVVPSPSPAPANGVAMGSAEGTEAAPQQ